jgi:hypothetical protein
MNPLSVTASIIADLQVTGSVVSAVHNSRKGVKYTPKNAAKIVQELTGLSHVLEKVCRLLRKNAD